ncbi:hypothetical protein Plhal710r2_c008g0035751 [Plasmopara halstedii]
MSSGHDDCCQSYQVGSKTTKLLEPPGPMPCTQLLLVTTRPACLKNNITTVELQVVERRVAVSPSLVPYS